MNRTSFIAFIFAATAVVAQAQKAKPAPATPTGSIQSLVASQQYDAALARIASALRTNPNEVKLWTMNGIVLAMKGNNTEAIAAFDRALDISPGYLAALKGEVQILFATSDKRAIPLLGKLILADPGDHTAQEMLALLSKHQGDCGSAVQHFALAEDTILSHPASLEAYGDCLVQLSQYEQAVPIFHKLVELVPSLPSPRYDLALVLLLSKRNAEAIKAIEPLLVGDQRSPDVLSLASQAYEATGDTPKAVALEREAIVLDPSRAESYVAFATLCLDHDSFQVGIDMIDAGLQRLPREASLYISRGLLYVQLAQYEKAESDFNRAEQLDSAQSLSSYAADLAAMQRNDPAKALRDVRSQIGAHPDSAFHRYLLAELLMNQSPSPDTPEFREAMESVQLAVKFKPGLAGARDLLASMYMHTGKFDLAIEQSRLALRDVPSDETAAYHLLISLRHAGQGSSDEVKAMVKKLGEMHQASLKQELDRKRYRFTDDQTPARPQ